MPCQKFRVAFISCLALAGTACRTPDSSASKLRESTGALAEAGATVNSAKMASDGQSIIVNVSHGGGCGDHDYSLAVGACQETYPVSCSAKLIHMTNDGCEALLTADAVIKLVDAKLNDAYYSGGTLRISGAGNSQASVKLPVLTGSGGGAGAGPGTSGAMFIAGAKILSGKYDAAKGSIELEVSYGGGCGDHAFELKVGACQETSPVGCTAELIHKTNDACEALVAGKASIKLKDAKLDDAYYSKGGLVIKGSEGSKASIKLPALPLQGGGSGGGAVGGSTGNANLFPGGAKIKGAKLRADKKAIEIDVTHGGGCGDHEYSLKIGACQETFPVSCTADLVHMTNDGCEALLAQKATIVLKDAGLSESYYSKGSLTIKGADGSKATVKLP